MQFHSICVQAAVRVHLAIPGIREGERAERSLVSQEEFLQRCHFSLIELVQPDLFGVEAAGHGLTQLHAASIAGGRPGVLHGNRTYLLMDADGQIQDAHSISAGLDYPGIGPEHSWLHETGRVKYLSATDDEALAAFLLLSRLEGIPPALEPAHAIAKVMDLAPKRPKDHLMVVNLSGRGDKDIPQITEILKSRKQK